MKKENMYVIDTQFLDCSICLKIFKQPQRLPCDHRFCFECIKEYELKTGKFLLPCPLCKVPFHFYEIQSDLLVQSICENIKKVHCVF
jgi:hypothetical protein